MKTAEEIINSLIICASPVRDEKELRAARQWLRDNATTEAQEESAGNEIARVLRVPLSGGKYSTTHGEKTAIGLCRTVAGILISNNA